MTQLTDTKTIQVNLNDLDSIEYAEQRKFELEHNGYELIDEIGGVFKCTLIYRKIEKLSNYDANKSFTV